MKPSGDFVVMEAKELLKLFDASGNAVKGTVLQSMTAPGTNQVQWSLNTECWVFERSKVVWMLNGSVFKCHSKSNQFNLSK